MEKTKKSPGKKGTGKMSLDAIAKAYKEYMMINGKKPSTVYKFCLDLGIAEEEFYRMYGSFESLERQIWKGYIEKTIKTLEDDDSFSAFTTREKLLAFYFTLMEILKSNRSFNSLLLSRQEKLEIIPSFLKDFKIGFDEFVGKIMMLGKANGEVAERPYLDKRYPQLFWVHMGLLLLFWKDDDSPGFEKTDALIEKSVNLAFDLIGKGAFDSAIDLAKFLYQSKLK